VAVSDFENGFRPRISRDVSVGLYDVQLHGK